MCESNLSKSKKKVCQNFDTLALNRIQQTLYFFQTLVHLLEWDKVFYYLRLINQSNVFANRECVDKEIHDLHDYIFLIYLEILTMQVITNFKQIKSKDL